MENQDLTVGTKVVSAFSRYSTCKPHNGIVKAPPQPCRLTGKMKVIVEWSYWNQKKLEEVFTETLMLETEGIALWSKLEAEYKVVEEQVKVKMQEAANAVEEADRIADSAKMNLTEMHDAVQILHHAMDGAGWSTSSLNC